MTNHIHYIGDPRGHEKLLSILNSLHSALPSDVLWLRQDEHDVTHLTGDGDLVLDIRDLFSPNGFWNRDLLRLWAMVHFFDLDGWNDSEMYWRMFEYTLFPAIAKLDNGEELLAAFQKAMVGGPVPSLPEFRIIVNGTYLMEWLVDSMDGPFESDEDRLAATRARSGGYRPSDKSPLPGSEDAA